jgi:hypothetical protein
MYGNITKRLILDTYMKEHDRVPNRDTLLKMPSNDFMELFKPDKRKDVDRYIAVLRHEGYVAVEKKSDGTLLIKITDAGLSAQGARLFKIKQDDLIIKGVINFLMTASTVAVAIITTITLLRGDKQIDKLRQELEQLRSAQSKSQVTTSPNIQDQKNYPKAMTLCDSSKKISSPVPIDGQKKDVKN